MPDFYEFFAGGGMARLGLGEEWNCIFANDIDQKKAASYRANFTGANELKIGDVAELTTADLPGIPDLAWASFPCQDLSLAGSGGGLKAKRSGTFWPFWNLMEHLRNEGRAPRFIVLENVYGAITSHQGKDFVAIAEAFTQAGYRFGALVIDAVYFLPQSRPRLFIIGVRSDCVIPARLEQKTRDLSWHPQALIARVNELSAAAKQQWTWWRLPVPPARATIFADLVEDDPQGVVWHTLEETQRLLEMMSERNRDKVRTEQAKRCRRVGGVYKRTRNGQQRAEVRFDDIAGCLRTPSGGSSRQTIIIVDGDVIRSRLLSPREAARLMGLPESYQLPERYNDAYHLAGDGVVVSVVRYLSENILGEIIMENKQLAAAV